MPKTETLGVLAAAAAVVLVGCAGGGRVSTAESYRPPDDAPFLLDPLRDYPPFVEAAVADRLRSAHRALTERADWQGALAVAEAVLAVSPQLHPARVLEAQALLVSGEPQASVEILTPITVRFPSYTPAQLLLGRAAERTGLLVEAFLAYAAAAARAPAGVERFNALRPRVTEILVNRIDEAIARGRLGDVDEPLTILERWAPDETLTLETIAEVARVRGDSDTELAAVRRLASQWPDDEGLGLRRARLELEAGDPGIGLRLLQDLVAAYPDDSTLAAELARARFVWRMGLLPEKVGSIARAPELRRGEMAAVLFWLFPSVRYGRAETGRIANDVLDHPHRQEIVRVVNLGLMSVDSRLHHFEPDETLSRSGALAAMLRALQRHRPEPACLVDQVVAFGLSAAGICQLAVGCGLLETEGDCRPEVAASGAAVLDWTQRALDQLGVE